MIYRTTTVLAILLLLVSNCNNQQKTHQEPPPPEVTIITVKTEPVELSTELPGRTSAFRVAEVRPRVNGLILKRYFTEGSFVKEGQLLYQIDPAPFEAALNNAKAALKKAEANVPALKLRLERYKDLLESKAVSQQEYDDVYASFQQALAEVEYWKANVTSSQINLSYTKVTAPISGRIGKSNVTEGAIVTAYQQMPLATIQQLDPIYVDVTQSTTELYELKKRLKEGRLKYSERNHSKVSIILEDGSLYPEEGTLQFKDVTVDPSTGSVILRIVVPNPENILLPGMFVKAKVREGINENAILVPQKAVSVDRKGNKIVYVVNSENKVEVRNIVIDRAIGNRWIVSEGLSPGDKVIVEGVQNIKVGSPVRITPYKESPQSE